MNRETFQKIFDETIGKSRAVLIDKAKQYASDADRLHNFKLAAVLERTTPVKALGGMMSKHTISVYDMIHSDAAFTQEMWDEKIIDSINYLILLRAVVIAEGAEAINAEAPDAENIPPSAGALDGVGREQ